MIDEHHGQGGSYVLDKKTGKRKLIERTCAECNLTEASTDGTAQPQTPDSGED